MAGYFEKPFAETGLKTAIPVDTTVDGSVSYEQGYGTDYEIDPVADPVNAKYPGLRDFNQLFFKISSNIKEWQEQTFPAWISDKGDGSPFSYSKDAIVTYTDGRAYVSLVDLNTGEPTVDTSNWKLFEDFGSININSLDPKTTPVDADELVLSDSEDSNLLKKLTFANLKATLDSTWVANDERAKTALNASGSAPIYACRAWVNFNGTGIVAIRESGNVSSITDNGTGTYAINLIESMEDTNYTITGSSDISATTQSLFSPDVSSNNTVSTCNIVTGSAGGLVDAEYVCVNIIR